jgi:hypothetical protein
VKSSAECLDGRDGDCGAAGDGKRGTPDTNLCGVMDEFPKRLCEATRLAIGCGEKKKGYDCGYEKEGVGG